MSSSAHVVSGWQLFSYLTHGSKCPHVLDCLPRLNSTKVKVKVILLPTVSWRVCLEVK
jgi:hypothetical protein